MPSSSPSTLFFCPVVGYHFVHLVLMLRRFRTLTLGHLDPLEPTVIALPVICSGLNLRLGVWVISRLTVVFVSPRFIRPYSLVCLLS